MTRDKILKAALAVFSKKGYHKAQMDEIAQKAKVAKGTIYYQFRSKSRLFAEMLSEGFEDILTGIRKELRSDLPFIDHFYRIIDKTIRLYLKHADLMSVFLNEVSSGLDKDVIKEIENTRERFVLFLIEMIEEGQNKGYLKQTDRRITAIGLVSLIDGLCNYQMKNPKTADPDDIVEAVFIILSSGLVKPK